MRPIIGITCNFDYRDEIGRITHMGIAGQKWHFLADNYINSVERAGGIPVMIPVCGDMETVKDMVSRMDGILISGGHDVDPQEYGERVKGYCGTIIPARDSQDIALARYVLEETDKPLLGICRGIQVLNVAAGGTIWQDLEIEGKFEHHFTDMYPMNAVSHKVHLQEESRLRDIFQREYLGVNSFHHQAIKTVGAGFWVTAVSEDGVTEAVERPDKPFVMGVQWHPEMMGDVEEQARIFEALVQACR